MILVSAARTSTQETTIMATYLQHDVGVDTQRTQIRCQACGGFVFADTGGVVVHRRSCDHRSDRTVHRVGTPVLHRESTSPQALTAASRRGEITSVTESEDEVLDAVRRGYVSQGDAMNRDF